MMGRLGRWGMGVLLVVSVVAILGLAGLTLYAVGQQSQARSALCDQWVEDQEEQRRVWFAILEGVESGGADVSEFKALIDGLIPEVAHDDCPY